MSSIKERPEKILILSCGSRGDCQPYIALGKELEASGYKVLLGCNVNSGKMAEDCGLDCFGVYLDCDKSLQENEAFKVSMAKGDTVKFAAGFSEVILENAAMHATGLKKVMTEFKPDLVIGGNLVDNHIASAIFWYEVPAFVVLSSYLVPSPTRMQFGLPNLPCGLNAWVIQNIFLRGMWKGPEQADVVAGDILGHKITEMLPWRFLLVEEAGDPKVIPRMVAVNSQWGEVMYPGINPSVRCVGSMALSSAVEEEIAKSDVETTFGCTSELEKVKTFIAAGSKPVFLGWGSMTCKSPEHMVTLVVTAVKLTGYRAIIQAGWAKLSLELLRSCAKDKSLVEYAESNILFIGTAPHEWLFPQCACTVQHGGCGTTTCSLRSGVPTVITPIFLDQFDFSYMVEKLSVGVGFSKQFQKISAKELSAAIVKCVSSEDIRAKAAEMRKTMHGQDGSKNVCAFVDDFWASEVRTGRQQRLAKEALQRFKNPRPSNTCTCCG